MMAKQIESPPFPALVRDDHSWAGEVLLRSWAGFQSRGGDYASGDSRDESDVRAELAVTSEANNETTPPMPEQVRAFQYLLDHEEAVARSVLAAIFAEYPKLRDIYAEYEAIGPMPALDRPEQLKPMIGLSGVHVLTVAKDEIAYIGFGFGCTWDDAHGWGVMTHRDRVVEVGGGDVALPAWIAERDAGIME